MDRFKRESGDKGWNMGLNSLAPLRCAEWHERAVIDAEAARNAALQVYGLAAEATAESVDRIAQLAADSFAVPIAIVSFVDENREWVISAVGTTVKDMSVAVSLAVHAIRAVDCLVIADAASHSSFRENPLVAGDQGWFLCRCAACPAEWPGDRRDQCRRFETQEQRS